MTSFRSSKLRRLKAYLQFIFVEDAEQVVGHEVVESAQEGVHLGPAAGGQPVLRQTLQVLVPVLCGDRCAGAATAQLHRLRSQPGGPVKLRSS